MLVGREGRMLIIPEDILLEALWSIGDVTDWFHLPGKGPVPHNRNTILLII